MVAAVAFSGVLTNTNTADAQSEGLSYKVTAVYDDADDDNSLSSGDTLVLTIALTGSDTADSADDTTFMVMKPSGAPEPTPTEAATCIVIAAADTSATVTFTQGGDDSLKGNYTVVASTADVCEDDGDLSESDRLPSKTVSMPDVGATASTNPGRSTQVVFAVPDDDEHDFRISTDSSSKGVFAAGSSTEVTCKDKSAACDRDQIEGTITLSLTAASDSPRGRIYAQRVMRGTGESIGEFVVDAEVRVNVSGVIPAAVIRATGTPAKSAIPQDGSSGSNISVIVLDATGNAVGGASLNVVALRGVLATTATGACDTSSPTTATSTRASCLAEAGAAGTEDAGKVTVSLFGNSLSGEATVTMTELVSGKTYEKTVQLYGTAGKISASADDMSVSPGGKFYVEVSITDAANNGVSGYTGVQTLRFAGPAADSVSLGLVADGKATPRANPDGTKTPLCFQTSPGASASDDPTPAGGTNNDGTCVIQVMAPAPPAAATRGEHTILIDGGYSGPPNNDKDQVSVSIVVSGQPDNFTTSVGDGEYVEPLSPTKITVTAVDDMGGAVGSQKLTVVQVEGSGRVTSGDTSGAQTDLKDGVGSFTFVAPRTGEAIFRITVGAGPAAISETLTVKIGESMGDMMEATWNNALVSGQNVVVWNGPDGADPSEGDAEGVTAIWWYNNGAQRWDGYFPDAAGVPGGNTLGSLSNGQAYVVIVN